jgi:hypothetical protein
MEHQMSGETTESHWSPEKFGSKKLTRGSILNGIEAAASQGAAASSRQVLIG